MASNVDSNGASPTTVTDFKGPDFLSILQTPLFTFHIGEDRTPMKIHTGAVKGISDPLDAMMNNGMRESITGIAVLEDVDVSTFAGFCEYIYSGAYKTPAREALPDPQEAETEKENLFSVIEPPLKRRRYYPSHEQEYSELRRAFTNLTNRDFRVPAPRGLLDTHFERPSNPDMTFHAKVYVFATQYLATPLRIYALKNLYYDLANCPLDEESAEAVMDLLLYVYDNTTDVDEPGGKSFLREMVMTFVSRKARHRNIKEQLMQCAAEDHELLSDLLARILKSN
ncbi:hypothetical protein PHISCL_03323 [Aspergillus sclerotialis]|uniref:BTB domain-containing protein n=1 Tax=Aspergillus sclerotialis TaxID=2070753 RepID=A0A3A2ZM73_9EURO|nr:hypothetical protein PHISCL_03323 [Aspergillus sclerotialis]